jgi:peptidoglycan/LPS O-acetylase OafA/YrhL
MYGALVAVLVRTRSLNDQNARLVYRTLFTVGLALTAVVIWLHPAELNSSPSDALWSAVGRLPFILVFVAALVYVVARNDGVPKPMMQPFYFLGYISYGLYLIHQLIFGLYDGLAGPAAHGFRAIALRDFIVVTISIGIAWLSRVYFEEPFLRRKNRVLGGAAHAHS